MIRPLDIFLFDSGDGGDINIKGKDIQIVRGWENMPYIALFGGNPGGLTRNEERQPDTQAKDWWGNKLLFGNKPGMWFNSRTEYTLKNVALNSAGLARIEEAVIEDLKFMAEFSTITVNVSLQTADRVLISALFIEPDNRIEKELRWLWDAVREIVITKDLIIKQEVSIFDDTFDDTFN